MEDVRKLFALKDV